MNDGNNELKEEKKSNDGGIGNIISDDDGLMRTCDVYEMYNVVQAPIKFMALIIDCRKDNEYRKCHIRHAIHVPMNVVKENDLKIMFNSHRFFDRIYVYGNMDDSDDVNKYATLIGKVYNDAFEVINSDDKCEFIVLKNGFEMFGKIFPFLCVKRDDISWEIMYKKSKKKQKKKPNMIELLYKRSDLYYDYPNIIMKDKLYLGRLSQLHNGSMFEDLKITHIINISNKQYGDHIQKKIKKLNIIVKEIKINDTREVDISEYFEETYNFIHKCIMNNGVILVHCLEGISRSASIVISYLMKKNKISLDKALQFVKQKRPVVDPNSGFVKQLQSFEDNQYCVTPNT